MGFRRAARTDANQTEIVKYLRSIGALVVITSQLKKFCDIVVSYKSRWYIIEIKDGNKFPKKFKAMTPEEKLDYAITKLTPDEKEFFEQCKFSGASYNIVWDIESALKAIS